jgi:predicted enzyme related to lactoylglutathione lyase
MTVDGIGGSISEPSLHIPDTTLSAAPAHSLFMNKPINWFEIPALDLNRASAFYENILAVTLTRGDEGPASLAVFPYDRDHATGGCLRQGPGMKPSAEGAVVYLNAGPSLNAALDRIVAAGGSIVQPRTELPPGVGAFAHILDSEGNKVGLHAYA